MKYFILTLLVIALDAQAATDSTPAAVTPKPAVAEATDFDSLGGNKILFDKAKALEPEKSVSVVQNRTVDLKNRIEIAPEFSGVFGGETYSKTSNVGLNVHYHINYNWSIGAKYNYSYNKLTPEGEAMVDKAIADYNQNPGSPSFPYPQLDYPKSETMALINWYPIYGKMSLFEKSVVHFDLYALLGYGQVELVSGNTPTYTGGGGLSFWLTNNFSTRIEMRYQNYTAKYLTQDQKMDLGIASVQMGWLL